MIMQWQKRHLRLCTRVVDFINNFGIKMNLRLKNRKEKVMGIKGRMERRILKWLWGEMKIFVEKYYEVKMEKKYKKVEGFVPLKNEFGVNLIGDIQAGTGLGQSMRMVADMLEQAEVPFVVRQMDVPGHIEHYESKWNYKLALKGRYGINLIHINNSIWKKNYNKIPFKELNGRYNIAFWLWELEEFPKEWISCIDTVDEIWTPSEFVSRGIRKETKKPVITMPYGVALDKSGLLGRKYFHLPENKFLFLAMYDLLSISERKNPYGIIKAYVKAFGKTDTGMGLVIKVNHLRDKSELDRLRKTLQGYPDIYFITNNLSRKEVESLIASVDVLVSLHRAEGFGLPLAEAMYLKTAVIATNWSSTVEFMDEDSACLVDYKLIPLTKDIGPYKKGNYWADADVEQAAKYMKELFRNREMYRNKVIRGEAHIKECLDFVKMSERMKARIKEIYGEYSLKLNE